jgi:hypothetical protein
MTSSFLVYSTCIQRRLWYNDLVSKATGISRRLSGGSLTMYLERSRAYPEHSQIQLAENDYSFTNRMIPR